MKENSTNSNKFSILGVADCVTKATVTWLDSSVFICFVTWVVCLSEMAS